MRIFLTLIVVAVLGAVAWVFATGAGPDGPAGYRFATVTRADFAVFTIATGRIEAIDVVEVSSQLSGQVGELSADFNDRVAAGAALARLDDKTYQAEVAEASAWASRASASATSAW